MKVRLKNKKAMSISIVLLVLATLILTSFALYTFYTKQKSVQEKIYITKFLEDIYSKEEIINFYINEIMENAFVKDRTQEDIISNFSAELEKYKDKNGNYVMPELSQVENQINNIKVENNKIEAEFEIMLKGNVTENGKAIFSAVYTYKKRFEKEI